MPEHLSSSAEIFVPIPLCDSADIAYDVLWLDLIFLDIPRGRPERERFTASQFFKCMPINDGKVERSQNKSFVVACVRHHAFCNTDQFTRYDRPPESNTARP